MSVFGENVEVLLPHINDIKVSASCAPKEADVIGNV